MKKTLTAALAAAFLLAGCGNTYSPDTPDDISAEAATAGYLGLIDDTPDEQEELTEETPEEDTPAEKAEMPETDEELPDLTLEGRRVKSYDSGKISADIPALSVKPAENANPLISSILCADPTAVEYDGRLYVYGTNDQQQYETAGKNTQNTYEHINTLVMLSTSDMANWTYHGAIDVKAAAPWIMASWAPSVVSREEEDGKTHFYMYFSNSGAGTGVITAESPTGPWTDPRGKPIISRKKKGLGGCQIPFDPGAVIDDEGIGWLSFGGGANSARIVKLGSDMISLDGDVAAIPSPYHNEASELNYMNGTFLYTYCNDWQTRTEWDIEGVSRPTICSMAYMTTKTPLDSESWEYRGQYFKNPGEQGLEYGNNHTHLQKYEGKYYLFYHAQFMEKSFETGGGFRGICVDEANVDEEKASVENVLGRKKGVSQIRYFDPFAANEAETMASSAGLKYNCGEDGLTVSVLAAEEEKAALILVKGADFSHSPSHFAARVKGSGRIEVYADEISGEPLGFAEFETSDEAVVCNAVLGEITGVHDLYFVVSQGAEFDKWQFV